MQFLKSSYSKGDKGWDRRAVHAVGEGKLVCSKGKWGCCNSALP